MMVLPNYVLESRVRDRVTFLNVTRQINSEQGTMYKVVLQCI